MSYSEEIVNSASSTLALRRKVRQHNTEQTRDYVYSVDPRIREIDHILCGTMAKIIGCTLRPNGLHTLEDLKQESLRLQEERLKRLSALNLDTGSLDTVYECPHCQDSGWMGTTMCTCLQKICGEEQLLQLSPLLRNNREGFANFRLDFYSKTPSVGCPSPYDTMSLLLEQALAYVEKFPQSKVKNLLFVGGTGQGKTFLSGCIAREISLKGGSVAYGTAIGIMGQFEARQFRKKEIEVFEEAERLCKGYLQSDLLILDDLSTETSTPNNDSYLYDLINSRLLANLHTIISTNYTLDELKHRYAPQVVSRLYGEYFEMAFPDGDLRKQKKEERNKKA